MVTQEGSEQQRQYPQHVEETRNGKINTWEGKRKISINLQHYEESQEANRTSGGAGMPSDILC